MMLHSVSMSMPAPLVVRLLHYVRVPRNLPMPLSRRAVLLRDAFTCQYCGRKDDLTFDHLVPRSRGGLTRWDNVVAACAPCNLAKGGFLAEEVGLRPYQLPYRPTVFELHRNGRLFPPNYLHESWLDYLYWDTELEP